MLGSDKQSLPQKKEGQLRTVVPHTLFFSKILATSSIVFLSLSFGNQASIRVVGYQTPAQGSQQYSPIAIYTYAKIDAYIIKLLPRLLVL